MDLLALERTQALTLARFNREADRSLRDFGYGDSVGAAALVQDNFERVAEVIAKRIDEIKRAHTGPDGHRHRRDLASTLGALDNPHLIAVTALSNLLHSYCVGGNARDVCLSIGRALMEECWAQGLWKENPELHKRLKEEAKKARSSRRGRQKWARKQAKEGGYRAKNWSRLAQFRAGDFLLGCCLQALPTVFGIEDTPHVEKVVIVLPGALERAERAVQEAVARSPKFVPCTTPPAGWTALRVGGFWADDTVFSAPFVRTTHRDDMKAMDQALRTGQMRPHIHAVDALQSVAWRINTRVLDLIRWCYQNGVPVGAEGTDLPDRTPRLLAYNLSAEPPRNERETQQQRIARASARKHDNALLSRRLMLAEDLAVADLMSSGAFWTPYNCDWRGRVYGVPHFNFQREDHIRGLFLFDKGMPIGADGLYWLKIHVANCGGFGKIDKAPFEERIAWTDRHLTAIEDTAKNPYSTARLRPAATAEWMWTQADQPFVFLAACMELSSALAAGSSYSTHLPVSFDGSCSGLQHLCAMTRAAEGALVNLTPSARPQDVYQTVADRVRENVLSEAALDYGPVEAVAKKCAQLGITRKWVKRNVMTYCYSSTEYGMAHQLQTDLMDPLGLDVLGGKYPEHPLAMPRRDSGEPDGGFAASKYIAKKAFAATQDTVPSAAAAMTFLQKCARALAHESKPLRWTTPTGMPWCNRYHPRLVHQVSTWLGSPREYKIRVAEGHEPEIDKNEATNGVAPNFVHALDAAHLVYTTNAAVSEGICELATVHDSFGCLAPQATRFRQIIREQFVEMYKRHDVLAEVLEATKRDLTVHDVRRLPDAVLPGPLNLTETLDAEYAFA